MEEVYRTVDYLRQRGWSLSAICDAAGFRSNSALSRIMSSRGSEGAPATHLLYYRRLLAAAEALGHSYNCDSVEGDKPAPEPAPPVPSDEEAWEALDEEDRAYLTMKRVRKALYQQADKLEEAITDTLPPYLSRAIAEMRDGILGLIEQVER